MVDVFLSLSFRRGSRRVRSQAEEAFYGLIVNDGCHPGLTPSPE